LGGEKGSCKWAVGKWGNGKRWTFKKPECSVIFETPAKHSNGRKYGSNPIPTFQSIAFPERRKTRKGPKFGMELRLGSDLQSES
jgi:hypothetical protein